MRASAKTTFCALYKYSGLMSAQEAITRRAGRPFMSIIVFHRVTDEVPEDNLTVSTARFEQMCQGLKTKFHVVPLAEIFRIVRSGEPFPPRTVSITFDDGYRDNFFAAQTLSRYGLPACFFIATSYMGTRKAFAWDHELPELPKLGWDEVRAMDRMGFEIGSHTHTHADLGVVPLDVVRQELRESKCILENQLGHRVRWFAYPFGEQNSFPPDRLPLVEEAGYEGCVSAYGGFVCPGVNSRMLPRQGVPACGPLALELRLSGCLEWLFLLRSKLNSRSLARSRAPVSVLAKELAAGEET